MRESARIWRMSRAELAVELEGLAKRVYGDLGPADFRVCPVLSGVQRTAANPRGSLHTPKFR